jgi:hypothetical protein
MEEEKKEESKLGKQITFLHAGCEVIGTIIRDTPETCGAIKYLYKAKDKKGIIYSITKPNFISIS